MHKNCICLLHLKLYNRYTRLFASFYDMDTATLYTYVYEYKPQL